MSNPMMPPPLPGYPSPAPGAGAPYPAYPAATAAASIAAPQGYPGPAVAAPAPALPPLPPGWEYGPGNTPRPVQAAPPAPVHAPPAPHYPPQAQAPTALAQHQAPPGANPFFGIKLPGERYPDVSVGNHVLDVEKSRLTEDKTAMIVGFRVAASDSMQVGSMCSAYINLYGYRSQQYSGDLAKLLLACVGFSNYEELQAAGPDALNAFTALATGAVQGVETALSGRRIACQGYNYTPKKGDNAGKTFIKEAFNPYRQAA